MSKLHVNLDRVALLEHAITNQEGVLGAEGQLCVSTGKHTGRAAKDKYVVEEGLRDSSLGGAAGKPLDALEFNALRCVVEGFLQAKDAYIVDFEAGGRKCRVICEKAWHALFTMNMFESTLTTLDEQATSKPDLTIVDLPSLNWGTNGTIIACDYVNGLVIIAGTEYAGEIKKSVFSYLSYVFPDENVMPMHASVATWDDPTRTSITTNVFFGLSGTGKTTLSSDPSFVLLGDDEHGWSDDGVFNFEKGCYAKVIDLSEQKEPQIWSAVHSYGTVVENVPLSSNRKLLLDDRKFTENTRAAYPLNKILSSHPVGTVVPHPRNIIMLTCDACGVLPSVAKLTEDQAAYHFVSGYTAKVAGTEAGVVEPVPTFSTCFGAPFMTRNVSTYISLLQERIRKHKCDVWLVNTGWVGGPVGVGNRIDIERSRSIVEMIVNGRMAQCVFQIDKGTGLSTPIIAYGADPRSMWNDKIAYDAELEKIKNLFKANMQKVGTNLPDSITKSCF